MNYGRPIKVLTDSIVYDDSLSGEEEHGRAFGMDDILLLRKFTTLFDNGVESREALDAVIDRCSAVQNIREAVLHYRKVFNQQHFEPRLRNAALKRSAEYLERYFWLITFAAYIGSENLDVAVVKGGYKNWLHEKPEVQALKWSVRVRPGRFFTIPVSSLPHYSGLDSCKMFCFYIFYFIGGIAVTTGGCSHGVNYQQTEWFCLVQRFHT